MEITQLLNKLIQKQNLVSSEASFILSEIIKGNVSDIRIAALLVAFAMKGETTEEIIGLIRTMREHMLPIHVDEAIDVCGTGGDGKGTVNISTAVSFVVASCQVTVAKHGNRAASSKSGSADVLEALGVNTNLTASQAERILKNVGMVFLFAPLFHPSMKQVAVVRKELKIRTVFNFLGPFTNPASVKRQLIGVPNLEIAERLAEVGKKLGYEHLMIVTSDDGMDEISICAPTTYFAIKGDKLEKGRIDPRDYGIRLVNKEAIVGGDATKNARTMQALLSGGKGAYRDVVVLNSAAALVVANKVKTIKDGIGLAEQAIDSGGAKGVLEGLVKETQKYA